MKYVFVSQKWPFVLFNQGNQVEKYRNAKGQIETRKEGIGSSKDLEKTEAETRVIDCLKPVWEVLGLFSDKTEFPNARPMYSFPLKVT